MSNLKVANYEICTHLPKIQFLKKMGINNTHFKTPYTGLNILKDLLEHSGKITCKLDYCSVSGELFLLWEQVDF